MLVLAGDHVLVGVVEIGLSDRARGGHVTVAERRLLTEELVEQAQQISGLHAFCFSLQVLHTRVQGIASSRADNRLATVATDPVGALVDAQQGLFDGLENFASVGFSLSWMWTSLFPVAWSARLPCRLLFSELEGLDAARGKKSRRLRTSASL